MQPDDLDGLVSLTDGAVRLTGPRRQEAEDPMTAQFRAILDERLYIAPQDGLTLGGAIARLSMLHEFQKSWVLTAEEFQGIKSRLFDL